jgi:aminoglycoside N3'-acetyltransferase
VVERSAVILDELFSRASLPAGRIFFLHARLRHIHQQMPEWSYPDLAQAVIARLRAFEPRAILVPAYTIYSFMHGGVFHRQFSRCETGRFSEEIRGAQHGWRSPDPMYSVLDSSDYLAGLKDIDYTRTFGENSLFEHLYQENEIILNLDLPGVWSTHFHQAEIAAQVPYRFHRQLDGVIYHDPGRWERVRYQAYLRATHADGGSYPGYNRENTRRYLLEQGVLHSLRHAQVELAWCEAQPFVAAVTRALARDPLFLVSR